MFISTKKIITEHLMLIHLKLNFSTKKKTCSYLYISMLPEVLKIITIPKHIPIYI